MPKNRKKGHFYVFLGFLAPLGPPREPRGRGFYINPSRRGPAVPREPGLRTPSRRDRGKPRKGAPGVSPGGGAAALLWEVAGARLPIL